MRSFAKIYSRVGSVATIIAFFSLYYIFLIGYCLWIQMLLINECWSWIQQLDKTLLFVLFIYFLRYLQIITILVFFFPISLIVPYSFFYFVLLHWLELPELCWIEAVIMIILGFLLTLNQCSWNLTTICYWATGLV